MVAGVEVRFLKCIWRVVSLLARSASVKVFPSPAYIQTSACPRGIEVPESEAFQWLLDKSRVLYRNGKDVNQPK